jgi:hypothetical protein
MVSSAPAIFFFPEGNGSHFFYGRSSIGGGLLTLVAAQQVEQNDCVYLGGEGAIMCDVGLCLECDKRECVVSSVLLSGGSLAQLHTSAAREEEALGVPCPSSAAQPQAAASAQAPSTLHFEPSKFQCSSAALPDAQKFFPEVVAAAVARKGEGAEAAFLIVRGELALRNCAWRECSTRGFSSLSTPAPPTHSLDSIAALLLRSFASREQEKQVEEEAGDAHPQQVASSGGQWEAARPLCSKGEGGACGGMH